MNFRLLMIGAMYENGGNTTHRFFDGHPQLFVYPFESQLGTRSVTDSLSSTFPVKYRWPVFALHATPAEDYHAIIDEECKVRARTPDVSKFRHVQFDFSDDERRDLYIRAVTARGRTRAGNIAAFFEATFKAWKNYQRTGRELMYVGYSPIIGVDAEQIVRELPEAHFLHVVRNPWSAYADTKKRPVPLSLANYMLGWTLNQYYARLAQKLYLDRVHIVRIEDVLDNSFKELGRICEKMGLEAAESLKRPSWNGTPLGEVAPWGTIRRATVEANRATAEELSAAEQDEVRDRAGPYLELFDYKSFV
jgi:Sulfotransferase family